MLNRLVCTIKLHQQIQWKHARPVKQQRYRGFARSYLQPGKRERNTTKGWESFPGVRSGRLTPPSWLMFFFFFTLQTLCCWHSRVSPSPTEVRVDSAAQKQRHTHGNAPPPDAPPEPLSVWVRMCENTVKLYPANISCEVKNTLMNRGTVQIPEFLIWVIYFIFASAYWEENQARLCQKRTKCLTRVEKSLVWNTSCLGKVWKLYCVSSAQALRHCSRALRHWFL